jgi:hypothetical protein
MMKRLEDGGLKAETQSIAATRKNSKQPRQMAKKGS